MTLFERFERHRRVYLLLLITAYFLINNGINATSVWMEHQRNGQSDIVLWEPFVWEYSSALSSLVLLPLVFFIAHRIPPRLTGLTKQVLLHLCGSLLFSILHVAIMVWLRELVYAMQGGNYDFGPLLREFFYEYRKDAWGYLFFYSLFHVYQFIYSRLKGEANLITSDPTDASAPARVPEHFLVKKLDKEFLVQVADIEWLESSGNYVNLYSKGRIYPLRATLNDTLTRLHDAGFSRIHRSFGVNHRAIDNITYLPSGDGEISLKDGLKLNLSRRYKEAFKDRFKT